MAVTPGIATGVRSPRRRKPDDSAGMDYLESIPRRVVTLYLPVAVFLLVLLFPFYWMAITTFNSNEELYNFRDFSQVAILYSFFVEHYVSSMTGAVKE